MAYDLVDQADHDILSEGCASLVSRSSLPPANFLRPISVGFESPRGNMTVEAGRMNENADSRLGSMIRSMASTGTSYDMLEEDDYEETGETVMNGKSQCSDLQPSFIRPQPQSASFEETGRIRTASVGPKLPLKHPTPELQSMQGACIKNVERLEESAERLSLTSSLKEEFQKMKFEQRHEQRQSSAPAANAPSTNPASRQISAASLSGSFIGIDSLTRSAGFTSSRQARSRKGSVLSASRSQASISRRPTSRDSCYAQPISERAVGRNSQDHARQNSTSGLETPQPPLCTYQPVTHATQSSVGRSPKHNAEEADEVRPSTSASNDTCRQATTLFVDFDGVHYTPQSHLSHNRQVSMNRQIAISQPPLSADAAAFDKPPPGEGMVYYPAPVPMMLNLPQKLSKQPSPAERERRRLKGLSAMPSEMRKSAAWLKETDKAMSANALRASQALPDLPPQIRASAFFDQPGLGQDIDIKSASAVETLDSILDASAHAPVSAFTDHPFAGHLGGEVYGAEKRYRKSATLERKKKRPNSISNLLPTSVGISSDTALPRPVSTAGISVTSQNKLVKRRSRMELNDEEAAQANGEDNPSRMTVDNEDVVDELMRPLVDDHECEQSEGGEDNEVEEDEDKDEELDGPAFSGPPTTLLAELQMRKAQQRLRNRTAANAFPNGMHSTLLELDAVAQIQQRSRGKKQITLAWEDHEAADPAGEDDDDIPLGILFAGQKAQQNINRPMGLIEKREMEDNEPLSRRRARLRGDDVTRPLANPPEQQHAHTMDTIDVPGVEDEVLEEREGESLAQRIQRIKAEAETATGVGAEFSKDDLAPVGPKTENVAPAATTIEAEETLGQRRKRLREEALKNSRQPSGGSSQNALGFKARSSMADILTQHPAACARRPSGEIKPVAQQVTLPPSVAQHDGSLKQMHTFQQPMTNPFLVHGLMPAYPSLNAGEPYMNGVAGFTYNNPMMYSPGLMMQMGGYNHSAYMHDPMMMGPPLDPKQRDMIDRWRQGVAP